VAVASHVSEKFGVPAFQLFGPSRGTGRVPFARQVAMYIGHVEFGLSLRQVGEGFGRDRTTVAYACRRIEDSRENCDIDRKILEASRAALSEVLSHGADRGAADCPFQTTTEAGE
jgi:chromosomal replication initiation ATPase DnaA